MYIANTIRHELEQVPRLASELASYVCVDRLQESLLRPDFTYSVLLIPSYRPTPTNNKPDSLSALATRRKNDDLHPPIRPPAPGLCQRPGVDPVTRDPRGSSGLQHTA